METWNEKLEELYTLWKKSGSTAGFVGEYQKYKEDLLKVLTKENPPKKKSLWRFWKWFKKPKKPLIFVGDKVFTMEQIIEEIKNDTEIGKDHIKMHKSLCEHFKKDISIPDEFSSGEK